MTIERFIVAYLNTISKKKYMIGGTKEFTIKYKNYKYKFIKLDNYDDDIITLYSYDGLDNDNNDDDDDIFLVNICLPLYSPILL
jgi:hypothetical protein